MKGDMLTKIAAIVSQGNSNDIIELSKMLDKAEAGKIMQT